MPLHRLTLALLVATLAGLSDAPLQAQPPARLWRVGLAAVAPTTLLDSGDGEVTTGPGAALELTRVWPLRDDLRGFVRGRLGRVATEAQRGPNTWDPGALTTVDATVGLMPLFGARWSVEVAAGVGLWNAPDGGAPFPSLQGLRPLLEAALCTALTPRLHLRAGLSGTIVGDDASRAQSGGAVLRPMLGVSRAF
jgi:hypothetical protein